MAWQPTRLRLVGQTFGTSMETTRVETDAGPAYLKAMGNPEGTHPLACEWVGTQLASWLGLPTFEVALIRLDDVQRFPLGNGRQAEPGAAFVARAADGVTWDGSATLLDQLVNPEDIARLVVFDTWTLNCDRFRADPRRRVNLGNVFLEKAEPDADRPLRLVAMDHTHCFTCGSELTPRLGHIGQSRSREVFGLFPAFRDRVTAAAVAPALARLRQMDTPTAKRIVRSIPTEWAVSAESRLALVELIVQRARFLADHLPTLLADL